MVPTKTTSRVMLRIPLGGDAPSEVRLFRYGDNETTQGTFIFDAISAASVMAADSDYGNERSADYEHQALFSPPVEAPASAWYRLALREDGLYAVEIRWTERARRMIEAGEYRYISPAFMVDPETNRVMEYINFALTNLPATKRMEALLKADPLANFIADNYPMLVANGLMSGVNTQQQEAVQALRNASRLYIDAFSEGEDAADYALNGITADTTDDAPAPAPAPTPDGDSSDDSSEREVVPEPVPPAPPVSPVSDSIDSSHGSSSLKGAGLSQETAVPTEDEDDFMMETVNVILETLGLSEDASNEDIRKAFEVFVTRDAPAPAKPKSDPLEPARIALGIKDGDGKVVSQGITTLKSQLDEANKKLSNAQIELEELRKDAEDQTVTMLLAEAREANKLKDDAHGRAIVTALTNSEGRVNVDALGSLIASLPEIVNITEAPKQEAPRAVEVTSSRWAERSWTDLKPTEKIKLFEEDPEEYQRKKTNYYNGK